MDLEDIGEVNPQAGLLAAAAAIVATYMMSTSGQGLVWLIATFVATLVVAYIIFLKTFGD